MPYNPSSAYPRHSTYTPPVEGRGFARAINEVDWGARYGHANQRPGVDVGHALRAAGQQADTSSLRAGLEAQYRTGMGSAALSAIDSRVQQTRNTTINRKIWNRAEFGDDPNEQGGGVGGGPTAPTGPAGPREIDTRTPEGRAEAQKLFPGRGGAPTRDPLLDSGPPGDFGDPFTSMTDRQRARGGREHVGGVSERLGPILQRVTTSSAANEVAQRVLGGKLGGPLTVPKLVFRAGRAANRRRKGGAGPAPTQDLPF